MVHFSGKISYATITDIHGGRDLEGGRIVGTDKKGMKMGSWMPILMPGFIKSVQGWNVDMVANMGDDMTIREDSWHGMFQAWQNELDYYFNQISVPIGKNVGNHCARIADTVRQNGGSYPLPTSHAIHLKDCLRAIFWNPNPNTWNAKEQAAGEDHKDWLRRELDSSDLPTVLFSHAPFEYYTDEDEIRDILGRYGHTFLAHHGHKHTPDRLEVFDGIVYHTQQSFLERQENQPYGNIPWGAIAKVNIDKDGVVIQRRNLAGSQDSQVDYVIPRGCESAHDIQIRYGAQEQALAQEP